MMHCGQILASLVSFLDHLVYTGIHMLQIFIKRAAVALAAAVVSLNLTFTQSFTDRPTSREILLQ